MGKRRELLFILNLLSAIYISLLAIIPYWVSQYVPFLMAYHYYAFAFMNGLVISTINTKSRGVILAVSLSAMLSVVTGSMYFNEAANAGDGIILGQRNYSNIAGTTKSLNVTTSSTDGTSSNAMYVMNLLGVIFSFVTAFVNITFYGIGFIRSTKSMCIGGTDKKLAEYSIVNGITIMSILGMLIVVYYIVGSMIMLTDSVVIISLVESPNTLCVFLIGVGVTLPEVITNKALYRLAHIYPAAWLFSLAITISSLVMTVNWRARQDNYFGNASMCPSRQIVQALTNNYTFTMPWDGVDQITYTNRSSWTPQTFADFTCADDALAFTLSIYSTIMFILACLYIQGLRSSDPTPEEETHNLIT